MTASDALSIRTFSDAADPSINELEYVVRNFDSHFANWRGKRIALHGTREYARTIVDVFDSSFQFTAIVSNDCEDASFAGKAVWSTERLLLEQPDLVILTERVRHAEAVYQEIGVACLEAGIAVFDMYGLDWLALRDEIDRQTTLTLEEWAELVSAYDIVSFELPDCLITVNAEAGKPSQICKPQMRRLVERIYSKGKRILFVGRQPYSADEQIRSLEASRLVPRDQDVRDLFFMRSGEDGAWRTIRSHYPDARILHIGFGIPKECVLPRYYGVDTYRMVEGIAQEDDRAQNERFALEALDPTSLRERLTDAIERADIVSFDVFDTLLMRTTLTPDDVFELVERRACERGLPASGYAQARSAAQRSADSGTAAQIYDTVQQTLGCTDAQRDKLYALEIEAEFDSIVARAPICELLRSALEAGKRVFLASDMYHSAETIAAFLERFHIEGYERLVVSSETGLLKRQGLFDAYAEPGVQPERIVHIGDGIRNDILPVQAAGMRAILIPSPLEQALAQGLNRAMSQDMTLNERCELARRITTEYSDPFAKGILPTVTGGPLPIPDRNVAAWCSWSSNAAFLEKAVVHVAPHDARVPVELRRALLAWYPFPHGKRALFLGSDREAFTPLLESRFDAIDFEFDSSETYDCIVALDLLENPVELAFLAKRFNAALAADGILIMGFRNRFGIKYLCGAIDAVVGDPFATLDAENRCGAFGKAEMQRLLADAGLQNVRTYYAMPDPGFTQAIYTDDYIPRTGIHDRVMPFDAYDSPLVAVERDLYESIVEEGALPFAANYFLAEFRKPGAAYPEKQVAHAALSLDRGREHSFITTLYTDETALKAAAHPEGRKALEALFANSRALRERGLSTVDVQVADDGLHMPFVRELPLLEYLDSLLPDDPDAFINVFEQLYEDVLRSSEHTSMGEAEARRIWHRGAADLEPVLQKGYIDMVPYNAFWEQEALCYFDQEFTLENCPAKYVLFRALRYTWIHLPHAERALSLKQLKRRFGLESLWDSFMRYEERFVADNRNRERYRDVYEWIHADAGEIAERRHALARPTAAEDGKPYGVGLLMGVFDLFHVGHLRLIKRAKARCRFLRVAVLDDAVVQRFKGICPTIPIAQRMEVIAAIADVDEVVAIEDNPSRLMEFERRPFDCFFSGDDYAGNEYWEHERQELEKHGATIEFFPYTEEQSSTAIRKELAERDVVGA